MQLVTRNYIKFPKWNNALRQLITSMTIPVIIFIFWFLSGGGGGENASFVQLLFSRQLSSFFLSVSSPYKRCILFWIENAIRAQLLQVPASTKLDPNPLFSREQLYEIENYRDHFPPNISLILRRPLMWCDAVLLFFCHHTFWGFPLPTLKAQTA